MLTVGYFQKEEISFLEEAKDILVHRLFYEAVRID